MTDVVVVGGGPAGLAAAIAARLAGLSAVVLERGRPAIDKACGEGLMPGGVAVLGDLGVPAAALGRPFRGIRYVAEDDPGVVAEGAFPSGRPGAGIRRIALHEALAARAAELGADLRWGVAATGLTDGGVATAAGGIAARVVVGADGLHSRVRRWAGLDAGPGARRRFGVRRHVAVAPWSEHVEVHWADGAEAYVTPVGAGETGIALLADAGQEPRFERLLERFPRLAERVRGAAPASAVRGAGPFHQRARGVVSGRVVLLGDAGGYLDPLTGEGLSLAFRQALALADAVAAGDLARYARAHARIVAPYKRMTGLLLEVQRRPRLRRRVLRALAARPDAFARFLGINDGGLPLRALGGPAGFAFAWRLVRP